MTIDAAPSFLDLLEINPKLQAGLCYDSDGYIAIKPEIQAMLSLEVSGICRGLLLQDRLSEANSLAACHHIHAFSSECPDHHEGAGAVISCHKPLLHRDCATPDALMAHFDYQHPELFHYLMSTSFTLITFTMPASGRGLRFDMIDGRGKAICLLSRSSYGFRWIAGFGEFYVIYQGDLPDYPTLARSWKQIAGDQATIKLKLYDGKDGDSQREGMRIAHSGFLSYWNDPSIDKLAVSEMFRGEDLTQLYGSFRKFKRSSPVCSEPIKCSTCGKDHVSCRGLMLTPSEALERFDHIITPQYGQNRRLLYRNIPTDYSPPPW